MLDIILSIIILMVVFVLIFVCERYKICRNELKTIKTTLRQKELKLSMLEYYYRNFKEGENPYTALRNISNLLKDVIV